MSICEEALMKFRIWQPSVKTLWHKKVVNALKLILDHVFNNEQVLKQCYRRLSVPHLLGHIGRCEKNILAVGSKNSWLINARTSHKRHFIGTKHSIGLSSPTSGPNLFSKLDNLALRYAALGSKVNVYLLHAKNSSIQHVGSINKTRNALFQPPGCSLPLKNGIKVPIFLRSPI